MTELVTRNTVTTFIVTPIITFLFVVRQSHAVTIPTIAFIFDTAVVGLVKLLSPKLKQALPLPIYVKLKVRKILEIST